MDSPIVLCEIKLMIVPKVTNDICKSIHGYLLSLRSKFGVVGITKLQTTNCPYRDWQFEVIQILLILDLVSK